MIEKVNEVIEEESEVEKIFEIDEPAMALMKGWLKDTPL